VWCSGKLMQRGDSSFGMSKHRTMGICPNWRHFTGPKRGKRLKRRKAVRVKRRHKNKYQRFSKAPSIL
jgi:hypothetical protein